MKRQILFLLAVTTIQAWVVSSTLAGPRLRLPLPFKRVKYDPSESYELHEQHGPWLIYAASFAGETGERQARRLVLELREKYKLNAYTFKRNYDYSQPVRGLGVDKKGNPKQMKNYHDSKFDETAVMIGDYHSSNDTKAQKVLEKVKYLKPETLSATKANPTSQRYRVWREIQRQVSGDPEMKRKGPMRSAFITRNPLLPDDYFVQSGPDRTIINLNKGLEYSLLECRKPYTVRVATFRGASTWDSKEIAHALKDQRSFLNQKESKLAQGAEKAARLVYALRKQGVEAYQFHDRYESMVTVGSFDLVGEKRGDGRIEINPEVHRIMAAYGAKKTDLNGLRSKDGQIIDVPGAMRPKTLAGIAFDAQPIPVKVPHMSGS